MRKAIMMAIAFVAMIVADQYTKYLAILYLKDQMPIPVIKDIFELQYLENRGAAFGSMEGKQIFLQLITVVILAAIVYACVKIPKEKRYVPLQIIFVMLGAGAIGNFIDRIFNGYVVDFLYFKWINFPIFNVADCYVTLGAIGLMILILFVYKEEEFEFLWKKKEDA